MEPIGVDTDSVTLIASLSDLGQEPAARGLADAVEYRMDLAEDDPLGALEQYQGELPVVATNRVVGEGGRAADEEDRLGLLAKAASLEFVFAVDIELDWLVGTGAAEVLQAAGPDTTVIASTHNFDETPAFEECQALLEAACEAGDIGKTAFQASTHGDALRVLQLAEWARTQDFAAATIAMGQAGRHTRALAPVYGSRLTYAPVDTEASTAPGQYDLETLHSLLELL